jgi:SAM-dependent methyltransferase
MRSYTAERYERLVEDTRDPRLQRYMEEERRFIARIPGVHGRTIVDLGAGHGRVVGDLARLGRNVVAIEINPDMFRGLEERARALPAVQAVRGDILDLEQLLMGETVVDPVFLILQNSIGTIEGDHEELLDVVRSQMRKYDGQLVLSLLRQPALADWGLEMYASLREMVGEVDLAATDTARGRFVTTNGYVSTWWTDSEIERFAHLGRVVDELATDEFHLLRLAPSPRARR